jgi:hypothetical protein
MQARFSPPSSLAAHHRRLMASCAESGCRQVRQRSGATLSARTVGESLCMSKSVEAHYKGQIVSARELPTGCQQRCSLVVPTVRATISDRSERQSPQKQPTRLATGTRRLSDRAGTVTGREMALPATRSLPGCSRPILGLDLRHDIRSTDRKGVSRFRGLRPEARRGPTSLVAVGWWCCGSPA